MNKRTKTALRRWCLYGWTFAKWTMAASAIGVVCGLIGTMFHFGVHEVTAFRGTHPWVLYLLPLAGFVIVSFYKLTETDGLGTDDIIDAVHEGKRLPILLLPAIFFGTVLTHLCGGSAGREGAALQMGGTIGQCMGRTSGWMTGISGWLRWRVWRHFSPPCSERRWRPRCLPSWSSASA